MRQYRLCMVLDYIFYPQSILYNCIRICLFKYFRSLNGLYRINRYFRIRKFSDCIIIWLFSFNENMFSSQFFRLPLKVMHNVRYVLKVFVHKTVLSRKARCTFGILCMRRSDICRNCCNVKAYSARKT